MRASDRMARLMGRSFLPAAVLLLIGPLCACAERTRGQAETFLAEPIACPAGPGSRLPRWGRDPAGRHLLGWVEEGREGEGSATARFRFAHLGPEGFGPVRLVAGGEDWFLNWADFPAIAALDDRNLLAHFLQRSADGTYDYQVMIVRSSDGGATWSEPARLHADPGPGEHGFVSLVPIDATRFAAVWLDGRGTAGHGAGGEPGAMSLYLRTVGTDGALGDEVLLDDRVCDCCPTSAVRTPDGALLVAYRDRTGNEVRDVSVVRVEEGAVSSAWTSADGWRIAGCPVNGPVLCAWGGRIALAWFTLGSDGAGRVLVAFSEDGGRTFSPPARIAGEPTSGRVDAVFDGEGRLVVAWLATDAGKEAWRVARIDPSGRASEVQVAAETSGTRESGLARLASTDEGIVLAFTGVEGGARVALRRLSWRSPARGRP